MWFAAENLRLIEKLYPGATTRPEIRLPSALDVESGEDEGRLALVKGHIECLGPVTPAELGGRTGLAGGAVSSLLAQIEGEGSVLRGRFRRGVDEEEWCDRRLLARIHRYTLDRLRQEIEPVTIQDFVRFLLRWQHVAPGTQLEGKRGLLEAVAQLQGFDIPAVAWERHILPARVAAYKGSWLDELCFSGDVTWARLGLRKGNGDAPYRLSQANSATPVSLARRADLRWLIAGIRPDGRVSARNGSSPEIPAAGAGRDILDLLRGQGALFYDDIVRESGRLPTDVERGLWDLVARGLVTADGFQALRSLMASTKKRNFRRPQRAKLFRTLSTAGTPSGRWSLLPAERKTEDEYRKSEVGERGDDRVIAEAQRLEKEALAEAWAEQLLFRYGVVFRDLTLREAFTVPWREILRVLRRMEAQGLVRGGRFVAGVYGEQYARPEAVEALRRTRRTEKKGEVVRVSAVDPLNLTGTVIPGARVPALHTNAVLYRDGLPIDASELPAAEPVRLLAAGS
jgi:ATP-dependent Lhr-like helicase